MNRVIQRFASKDLFSGAITLEQKVLLLPVALLLAAGSLAAQTPYLSSSLAANDTEGGSYRPTPSVQSGPAYSGPFSRVAIGGGFTTLGPGVQITTNLADHLNLRVSGNGLHFGASFSTNGFDANAKLNLVSAGVAADIYPFHRGFRISPGVLVLNNNKVSATSVAAGGTSFTLNDTTYYSATANPATGATPLHADGSLGLNTNKPAFTLTTGWGNTIPRNGGHWSFPAEVGVAFIGSPAVNVTLSGWACQDQAQTQCSDVTSTTDTTAQDVQSNLAAQIAKWKSDLDALKTYPVLSFGVAYSFAVRGGGGAH
jgi:hypothetical protein